MCCFIPFQAIILPLAQLLGFDTSPAEQRAKDLELQQVMVECMKDEGWEYRAVDYSAQGGDFMADDDSTAVEESTGTDDTVVAPLRHIVGDVKVGRLTQDFSDGRALGKQARRSGALVPLTLARVRRRLGAR